MEFINPTFLWALLILALPILIHLFYFRRYKKVYFTNVNILKEVKEETSTRNKIRDLLVLLFRLLAIAALVFAFAQPFIPQGEAVKKGNNAVSVFVDNSFSMDAKKDEVPLIDIAKAKARQIVKAYTPQDRFQILTHDFEGRHQRLIDQEDALAYIEEINMTPKVKKLSNIIDRQRQTVKGEEDNAVSYVISDFQASIMDNVTVDTTTDINLIPLQPIQENNVSIDTAYLASLVPIINQNNQIIVTITNHGNADVDGVRLSSMVGQQEIPEGVFDIGAGKTIIDTINVDLIKAGTHEVTLKISDYPVQFDDTYLISLDVPERISVLSIYEGNTNRYLNALFQGIASYDLTNQQVNQVNYSEFPNYDLIIVNDLNSISSGLSSQLDKYVNSGGNVLAFPGMDMNIDDYNRFLSELTVDVFSEMNTSPNEVKSINTAEFVFKDVYSNVTKNMSLPQVKQYFEINRIQNRGQEPLLRFRDGKTFIGKYVRNGHIYLCASPLNVQYSDLVQRAEVFVPMIYKMAIANSKGSKIAHTIGKDRLVELMKSSSPELIYKISGKEEFIPGQKNLGDKVILDVQDQVTQEGFYDILLEEQKMGNLAFNYDRTESDMALLDASELETLAGEMGGSIISGSMDQDISTMIAERERGMPLWKYFIIATLVFLGIEVLLLKFWKPNKV